MKTSISAAVLGALVGLVLGYVIWHEWLWQAWT